MQGGLHWACLAIVVGRVLGYVLSVFRVCVYVCSGYVLDVLWLCCRSVLGSNVSML